MSTKKLVLITALVVTFVGFLLGAIGAALRGAEPLVPIPEVHLAADPVFTIGGFTVTNTLLSAWLTTIIVLLLFGLPTRNMRLIPGRFQGFIEMFIEALFGFMKGVAGERLARQLFPILATIFIFVAFNAWMALLPFYPTVSVESEGHHVHLFRSAGTDINMPLALAVISFIFVEAWGFRVHRIGYLKEFIRVPNPIQFFIGLIELLSHFIRMVSFTFRLFGNMVAGEIVLMMMTFLLVFIAPLAFYGLELLVGGVQALIFMGLTLVFAVMAGAAHEEHAQEEHAHEAHERERPQVST
ncbi:MAG: FoF1 ATP synthase subunit a [Dehalococcoidia bacterium]